VTHPPRCDGEAVAHDGRRRGAEAVAAHAPD
jgi:hypothetical protein